MRYVAFDPARLREMVELRLASVRQEIVPPADIDVAAHLDVHERVREKLAALCEDDVAFDLTGQQQWAVITRVLFQSGRAFNPATTQMLLQSPKTNPDTVHLSMLRLERSSYVRMKKQF